MLHTMRKKKILAVIARRFLSKQSPTQCTHRQSGSVHHAGDCRAAKDAARNDNTCQPCEIGLYFWLFILLLTAAVFGHDADTTRTAIQPKPLGPPVVDSTRITPVAVAEAPAEAIVDIKGVLSEEEMRFYRSDFFPLSLLNRGRQAVSAYQGMPPGFLDPVFGGRRLRNPLSGFWNEQWLPYYLTGEQTLAPDNAAAVFSPLVPVTNKPVTRVVFSQDYIINLSFLDISFYKRLNASDYIQLSGGNFLGDGSESFDYSAFKLNTYRGQWHKRLGTHWQMDGYYWQMRQAFNLAPEGFLAAPTPANSTPRDKFKQIGHLAWITFQGKLSARDSLVLVPGYTTVLDRYSEGLNDRRDNRDHIIDGRLTYLRRFGRTHGGMEAQGSYFRNRDKGDRFWPTRSEWDGEASLLIQREEGSFTYHLRGGGYYHSAGGAAPLLGVSLEKQFAGGELALNAFSRPQPVPLLWRSIVADSLPADPDDQPILRQGVSARLGVRLGERFHLALNPFYFQVPDYPWLADGQTGWTRRDVKNAGLRVSGEWRFWRFQLQNDFTYNRRYQDAFAPQFNNITLLKAALPLFNNALKLETVLAWHWLGKYRTIRLNRLLNYYFAEDTFQDPLQIGDVRIQAQFRDATLFFIWENITSTDYSIVKDSWENLLIFRLGIDWVLFN